MIGHKLITKQTGAAGRICNAVSWVAFARAVGHPAIRAAAAAGAAGSAVEAVTSAKEKVNAG